MCRSARSAERAISLIIEWAALRIIGHNNILDLSADGQVDVSKGTKDDGD